MMNTRPRRAVPRPFKLHWGSGQIVEEATHAGEHHEASLQLLEFEGGEIEIRFCYYNLAGRFQRSPLIVGPNELAGLRDALSATPRLRSLLRQMVG